LSDRTPSEDVESATATSAAPPKRFGPTRRATSIFLVVLVLLSSLGILGLAYLDLRIKHQALQTNYDDLDLVHSQLAADYYQVADAHSQLSAEYSRLSNDHGNLSEAFYSPLSFEARPSISELKAWLLSDVTSGIGYDDPDFMCGDFAVMLAQHAKLKHWDIGIVGVSGYTDSHANYSHAFNAIVCDEGLVYVEPSNNHVWWYNAFQEIQIGFRTDIDGTYVHVQDYVVVVSFS